MCFVFMVFTYLMLTLLQFFSSFVPCTIEEAETLFCSLKSNSSGVDGLNLKAFNFMSVHLLPVLVYLIHLSMVKGHFPLELKRSKIIPLHKGGDSLDPCNW